VPNSRSLALITVEGIKDLKRRGVSYRVRYELVEPADGRRPPRYRCIYDVSGSGEALLVGARISKHGPEERHFLLWPGLFAHHLEFGDGEPVCVFPDYSIRVGGRFDGDPPGRDD
jgi:hypothetical protein